MNLPRWKFVILVVSFALTVSVTSCWAKVSPERIRNDKIISSRDLSFNETDSTTTTTTTTVEFLYTPVSADAQSSSTLTTPALETDLSTVLEYVLLTQYSDWISQHNLQILRRTSFQSVANINDSTTTTTTALRMQCFLQHDQTLPARDVQQALYQHAAAFSGRLPADSIRQNQWPGTLRQVPLTLTLQFDNAAEDMVLPSGDELPTFLEEALLAFLSTANQTEADKWINVQLSLNDDVDDNNSVPAQRRFLRKTTEPRRRLQDFQFSGYGVVASAGIDSNADSSFMTTLTQTEQFDELLLQSIAQSAQIDESQQAALLGLSQAKLVFNTDSVETLVELNAGLGALDDEPVFAVENNENQIEGSSNSPSIVPLILMITAGLLIVGTLVYLWIQHRKKTKQSEKVDEALEAADHQRDSERAFSDWDFSQSSPKENATLADNIVPLSPSPEKPYSPSKSLDTASDSGNDDIWPEEVFADEDSELLADAQNNDKSKHSHDKAATESAKKKTTKKKAKESKSKSPDTVSDTMESEDGSWPEDVFADEDAELLTKKKKTKARKKKDKKKRDKKTAKKEADLSEKEESSIDLNDQYSSSERLFMNDTGSSVALEEVTFELDDPHGFKAEFEGSDSEMSDISDVEHSPPTEAYKRTPRPGPHEFVHYPSDVLLGDSADNNSNEENDLFLDDHPQDSGMHNVSDEDDENDGDDAVSSRPRLGDFVLPSVMSLDDATACSGVSERHVFRDDRSYDGSVISMESNLGLSQVPMGSQQDGKSAVLKDRIRTKKKRRGRKRDAKPPPDNDDGGNIL